MSSANGRKEVVVGCRYRRGVVEYDADGIPVVFRWVCRNHECCPPQVGHRALHRFTIYGVQDGRRVGEYSKEYEPLRPLEEVATVLPAKVVRHIDHRPVSSRQE